MSAEILPPVSVAEQARAAQRDALEQVILVDEQDRPLSIAGKLEAHRLGQLHRAFSILIFNQHDELLLQQRARVKYHFGCLWSNTCCGHPRPDEPIEAAARRRLHEEFGIRAELNEQIEFVYRTEDPASGLIEHEYLHVFHGRCTVSPRPDPVEIGAWRWLAVPRVRRAVGLHPDWFTPWFRLLVERVL
ncbi:isopentenyl-diphosphate Delta-isomerase [Caldichromatium japonicum]|uniref:Isopentenyl-diphosphate Delta-isomerase n=1 Tax=Caldichromatium japonicum TaxID=2699430 RepID=A0A6G7VFK1_9GAMM|nr:isopentenyl-diphosphate Delta-isomerase [Caldichromatium japonicum]QIK38680.1 isopentenyl-diphosphate Delta-isomerase [Caldichromatium japonicum]